MGAGAVGCFLGGLLLSAGMTVYFVGRARVLGDLHRRGLHLSDLDGFDRHFPASGLHLHDTVPAALAPEVTLLCVKSSATREAATQVAQVLAPGSLVVSMQNGIGNALAAQSVAPALDVRAGMVAFNVAELAPGHFHRGSAGGLAAQGAPTEARLHALKAAFAQSNMALDLQADLTAMQWGKLLLNLNNPINALSGLPLREQLLQRDFRCCLAALLQEALDLLQAAHMPVAALTPLPARQVPRLLRLPTPLFRLLAARMLKMDAKARSSMADDLAAGRPTEIDALCGEVLRLAQRLQRTAPCNARMLALVTAWPQRCQAYGAAQLRKALDA